MAGESTNSGQKKIFSKQKINFIKTFCCMRKYKWGILGTGNIARKFCCSLRLLDNAAIHAVGSRDKARADEFAADLHITKAYGSYRELAADPEIDIIYIATPHTCHLENTLMSLRGGKHVICEKPLSINLKEVSQMTEEAGRYGLFFMEALWPPFQPSFIKAKEIIDSGSYGKILHMRGKFGFNAGYDPLKRTYNIGLGGGSLLDIGIYPILDILRFMGVPDEVAAWANIAPTGADESISVMFRYNDGRLAEAYSTFNAPAGISTEINCQGGNITLSRDRKGGQRLQLDFYGAQNEELIFNPACGGYQFEAAEVMRCLDEGLKESPVVPHSLSLDLIRILDQVREKAGIVYPGRD